MKLENIKKLETELREGLKRFYVNNKPLSVAEWYDCFLSNGNSETDHLIYNDEVVYFNIEGKTVDGVYFNIKSSDTLAKKIIIK